MTGEPDPFTEYVREALDSLPEDIAARLDNVAVEVSDERAGRPAVLGLAHHFGISDSRLRELDRY
jgi:predicted Zn-dependent protease with MMP-like domain